MARTRKANVTITDPATSAYIDLTWRVAGSRGDTYSVTLLRSGWMCSCMGYKSWGYCKHIAATDELLAGDHDDPVYAPVMASGVGF